MNNPLKKTKQSSLNEFYKKQEHHELKHAISLQKVAVQDDSDKFVSNNQSVGNQVLLNPSPGNQTYSNLDINSNVKAKMQGISMSNQNEFRHLEQNFNLFKRTQISKPHLSNGLNEPQTQQKIAKAFGNQYSDIDYNLSVQPQQIRIPEVIGYQDQINRLKPNDEEKLQSNFLITPQNSLIKSPQRLKEGQMENFTPEVNKRQPPTSEIVQRLHFNAYKAENSQQESFINAKEYSLLNNAEDQPYISPSPFSNPINKIKSPTQYTSLLGSSREYAHENYILSSDDQDASQLVSKIKQLESQVSELKCHKYQFAIGKYRQEVRCELQEQLQISIRDVNYKYEQKQAGLRKDAQIQISLFSKSIEDITKYKKTYTIIVGQLKQNKQKIQEQYRDKVDEVRKHKQRLINEWKRQSNQDIKKIVNNTHSKHSARLSAEKQRVGSRQHGAGTSK